MKTLIQLAEEYHVSRQHMSLIVKKAEEAEGKPIYIKQGATKLFDDDAEKHISELLTGSSEDMKPTPTPDTAIVLEEMKSQYEKRIDDLTTQYEKRIEDLKKRVESLEKTKAIDDETIRDLSRANARQLLQIHDKLFNSDTTKILIDGVQGEAQPEEKSVQDDHAEAETERPGIIQRLRTWLIEKC